MAINTNIHTVAAPAARRFRGANTMSRRANYGLWATQGVLAAIFLFAGASKLVLPAEELTKDSEFPALFLRFIGACELFGAVGLVAPWALRIKPGLTPLAAAGLAIIMAGAAVTVALTMNPAFALINVAILAACIVVVRGRSGYGSRSR